MEMAAERGLSALITRTPLYEIVALKWRLPVESLIPFISSARASASAWVRFLPALLSTILLPLADARFALRARSPSLRSSPAPTASTTPLPG